MHNFIKFYFRILVKSIAFVCFSEKVKIPERQVFFAQKFEIVKKISWKIFINIRRRKVQVGSQIPKLFFKKNIEEYWKEDYSILIIYIGF